MATVTFVMSKGKQVPCVVWCFREDDVVSTTKLRSNNTCARKIHTSQI